MVDVNITDIIKLFAYSWGPPAYDTGFVNISFSKKYHQPKNSFKITSDQVQLAQSLLDTGIQRMIFKYMLNFQQHNVNIDPILEYNWMMVGGVVAQLLPAE